MIASLLAVLLASSAPQDPPKVDATEAICTARFVDNLKRVAEGGEPNSTLIEEFVAEKVEKKDQPDALAYLLHSCGMFDKGALFMIQFQSIVTRTPEPEDEPEEETEPAPYIAAASM